MAVLRLDALLGIVITGLVFDLVLASKIHLTGAVSGWYPYPFLDAATIGYAHALRNTAVIFVSAVLLAVMFTLLDRVRTVVRAPAGAARAGRTDRPRPRAGSRTR